LFLQRTIGNQAVGRLIKSGALKTKLNIGQPGDIYEQEADRVAGQVMRIPEPQVSKETKVPEATSKLESSINAARGGGQPLPEPVRTYMEPRFGHDFSLVRVHTGGHAIQMNRDVGAKAFTHGTDIYFGAGHSPANLELTAHELTHVVQQTGGGAVLTHGAPAVQRQDTASEGEKRMYRTSDGKMVELPPDMTAEEAAKLEAEAKMAEKKLGKRPPPKPVPDVKKIAIKPERKEKPKPGIKVKKDDKGKRKGKGKAAPKAGGAAMLEAVGHSEVAKYLAQ
ncbi:MAG: DUF4157 domain-containing protein, partial [Candidatus Methanoperedens sp.]|nr:DUF4157 domain-containing protein [Candidatus Methanoperedens sp.]